MPLQIVAARPQFKERRLRLIHAGRLLTDGTLLHSWLSTLEERQLRANESPSDDLPSQPHIITWLHCSVGPKIDPGAQVEDEPQVCPDACGAVEALTDDTGRLHNCGHCVVSTAWSQLGSQRMTFPTFGGSSIASRRQTISTSSLKTTRTVCRCRVFLGMNLTYLLR